MYKIATALDNSQCDFEQMRKLLNIWYEQWDEAPDDEEQNDWKLALFIQRQRLYKALIDSVWDKLVCMEDKIRTLTDQAYEIAKQEVKTA